VVTDEIDQKITNCAKIEICFLCASHNVHSVKV